MRRAIAAGAVTLALAWGAAAAEAKPAVPARGVPAAPREFQPLGPGYDRPHHEVLPGIEVGGQAELRFASDRVLGVGNPDWASVQRVGAFARARLKPNLVVVADVAYDKATDDLIIERALVVARVRDRLNAQAGILLLPLGRANLEPDAPRAEFNERSLVATEIVGVPNAQLGAGVRGLRPSLGGRPMSFEVDLVTGYDDGLVNDSPLGTRLPRGRNNGLDNNGVPAFVGRVTVQPAAGSEVGFAAYAGSYNSRKAGGVTVDRSRALALAVADARAAIAGFQLAGEAAIDWVDVPPGLQGLFAERQWGGSLEVARTLRGPLLRTWPGSSLGAALRADAVDLDRAVSGDSKSRVTASLNLKPQPGGVIRLGWYYELRRDRFNNDVPAAGLTVSVATYL